MKTMGYVKMTSIFLLLSQIHPSQKQNPVLLHLEAHYYNRNLVNFLDKKEGTRKPIK